MQKRLIVLIFFCYGILMGASFFRPLVIQKIIDNGLVKRNFNIVLIFVILLIILALVEAGIEILQAKLFVNLKKKFVLGLYTKVFYRVLHTQLKFFSKNNSAGIINKISTDIDNISIIFDSNMMSVLSYVLQIISGIVGLFVISWKLAFLVLLVIPIKYILIRIFSKKREKATENWIKESTSFSASLGDMINGINEIKLWNLYKKKIQELRNHQRNVLIQEKRNTLLEAYNSSSDSLVQWIIIAMLYGIGGYMVCKDNLSIGGLTAFISYSNYVVGPIALVFNIKFLFARIKPSLERIQTLLNLETEQSSGSLNHVFTFKNELRLDKVTFSYEKQPLLQEVDFCIHKGEKVAIVGKNGCGKSTLIKLILRFISPQSGSIYMDGVNIEEYDLEQYRNLFGVVNQDIYLFDDTFKNNITLGKEVSNEILEDIYNKMNLQELADEVSVRHEGKLEGNGDNLSGGERQKIALVRALVKDAPILIFDEATSNVDEKYSQFLHNVLMKDFSDKTMIIVTHKKEYLQGMDRVFQMK